MVHNKYARKIGVFLALFTQNPVDLGTICCENPV